MTVQQLIRELSKYDPKAKVHVVDNDDAGEWNVTDVDVDLEDNVVALFVSLSDNVDEAGHPPR